MEIELFRSAFHSRKREMREGWLEFVLPEGGAEIRQVVVGTPTFRPCVHCCVMLSKTQDMKTIFKQIKQPSKFGGLGAPGGGGSLG